MSLALVFSGQGHQHAGMLSWLDAEAGSASLADDDLASGRALIAQMQRRLGLVDWRSALEDDAWARVNRHAQLLITAVELAAWRLLRAHLPEPVGIAGYSVGELAAFSAAGAIEASRTIKLAEERAVLMDQAGVARPGGLSGVTGLLRADIDRIAAPTPVTVAIVNGEDSVVLGGPLGALSEVESLATARGARCTRLAVAIASHTPIMAPAAKTFGEVLGREAIAAPSMPLYSNAADRVWTAPQAREALARQIATTVRWDVCMDQLAQRLPRCLLEIGGGQSLARLWQQRYPQIPARSADEFHSSQGVIDWVRRCCAD